MSSEIKAIPTKYKGIPFRSRLEARWAVFFDEAGIEWEYEPRRFSMKHRMVYTPDFLLKNVRHRGGESLYAEIKGANNYSDIDFDARVRIEMFSENMPLIVLGNVPHDGWDAVTNSDYLLFSFSFLDGDGYPGFFSKHDGEIWFSGPDHDEFHPNSFDWELSVARQARFGHEEEPKTKKKKSIQKDDKFDQFCREVRAASKKKAEQEKIEKGKREIAEVIESDGTNTFAHEIMLEEYFKNSINGYKYVDFGVDGVMLETAPNKSAWRWVRVDKTRLSDDEFWRMWEQHKNAITERGYRQ